MAWILLVVAGLLEVSWSIGMKHSDGLTKAWPTVFTIALSITSFVLLAQAVKTLPVGTAYAVWTGIGAVGACILGMLLFKESTNPWRILCIALVIAGVIGLKLTTKT